MADSFWATGAWMRFHSVQVVSAAMAIMER